MFLHGATSHILWPLNTYEDCSRTNYSAHFYQTLITAFETSMYHSPNRSNSNLNRFGNLRFGTVRQNYQPEYISLRDMWGDQMP